MYLQYNDHSPVIIDVEIIGMQGCMATFSPTSPINFICYRRVFLVPKIPVKEDTSSFIALYHCSHPATCSSFLENDPDRLAIWLYILSGCVPYDRCEPHILLFPSQPCGPLPSMHQHVCSKDINPADKGSVPPGTFCR